MDMHLRVFPGAWIGKGSTVTEANARESEQTPRQGGSDSRHLLIMGLWVVALTALWSVAVYSVRIDAWFPEASQEAVSVDNLFKFMLAAGGGIFILVQVLIVAFVMRYRAQNRNPESGYGPQVHGNTRIELAWTIAPVMLLVVLLAGSLAVWGQEHPGRTASQVNLVVHGAQYAWSYDLPAYGIKGVSEVALPVGKQVYVDEYSTDVIHSFWIPEFRIKADDVPAADGRGNWISISHETFTPSETGTFRVICTEFCGSGHSTMHGPIEVLSPTKWIAWLRKNGANPKSIPSVNQVASLIRQ